MCKCSGNTAVGDGHSMKTNDVSPKLSPNPYIQFATEAHRHSSVQAANATRGGSIMTAI